MITAPVSDSPDLARIDAVAALLKDLTHAERARVDAYLRHDNATAAAAELGCDRETVTRTWRRFSRRLRQFIVAGSTPQTATNSPKPRPKH